MSKTKTNKKGRKLLDDVNADHQRMWERREMQLADFKAGAQEFIGQIKGQSTGQHDWSRGDFQQKKQSSWLKKRGIFDGDTVATPEQVMRKKKKDAKAKVAEAKRLAKRQRGSNTLKKRKSEVPEYLKKLEELKKYKKGFTLVYAQYKYLLNVVGQDRISNTEVWEKLWALQPKLEKLGLVK